VIVVMVVGRTLTGPVGSLSTAGLAVIAATTRVGPNLSHVVGHYQPQFGGQGSVVLPEVGDGGTKARSFHLLNIDVIHDAGGDEWASRGDR
jgi:hypothetical protein